MLEYLIIFKILKTRTKIEKRNTVPVRLEQCFLNILYFSVWKNWKLYASKYRTYKRTCVYILRGGLATFGKFMEQGNRVLNHLNSCTIKISMNS